MTTLSEYLRAERVDNTQEASFYAPGVWGWDDPSLRGYRIRALHAVTDDESEFEGDEESLQG